MPTLKIKLTPNDTIKGILECIRKFEGETVFFKIERSIPFLSDISVLKKIQSELDQSNKKCVFVTEQEFLKKVFEFQKFEVINRLSEEDEASLQTIEAWKNPPKIPEEITEMLEEESIALESKEEDIEAEPPLKGFQKRSIDEEEIKNPKRGLVFFCVFILCGILGGIVIWISPKAIITIKPEVSVIPITQNFLIQLPQEEEAKIPLLPVVRGIYVENEVKEKQTFPTTGKRYDITNAYGSITLYNETDQPKFLVPSRLSTHDGVILRFSEEITIPPRVGDDPGSIIVSVTADEYDSNEKPIGHRGNIQAGTELFFPALRENLREVYYGIANRGPLVGGSTLVHYFMAEDDIEKTKEFLEESFRQRALDQLKNEVRQRSEREGKNYILLDHPALLKSEIIEEVFPEELIGQEVEAFEVYVNLRLNGIVFDQDEVIRYLEKKVEETQDARKKLLYIDEVSAHYSVLKPLELIVDTGRTKTEAELLEEQKPQSYINDDNQVKVSVQMKGVEMYDFYASSLDSEEWRLSLKKEIAGKTAQETLSILTNFPEIENITDIYIAPFWSESIPRLFDQIEFVVME